MSVYVSVCQELPRAAKTFQGGAKGKRGGRTDGKRRHDHSEEIGALGGFHWGGLCFGGKVRGWHDVHIYIHKYTSLTAGN